MKDDAPTFVGLPARPVSRRTVVKGAGVTLGVDDAIGEGVVSDQRHVAADPAGGRRDVCINKDRTARLQGQVADA